MKFASVLIVIVFILIKTTHQELTEEQKGRIHKYRDECIGETNVNPEYIERATNGDFVEDDRLKCYAKCFYQKVGFVDAEGKLLVDAIKAKIPADSREKALSVIEKCKELKGVDSCETIYLVHKCYFHSTRNASATN